MSALDKVVNEYTARGSNGVPGIVLSVIDKQGKTLLSRTSGYVSHLLDAEPVTPSHIFRQASATKFLTIISTLQLVQRGLISLDDASLIDEHLPEITRQQIIHLAEDGALSYTTRTKPITLRHMLTHTSGIGYDIFAPTLLLWRKEQGIIDLSTLRTKFMGGKMADGIATPLLFEPGEGWVYGAGIDAAGVLIERVTGLNLEKYMAKNIFSVLGMESSGFFVKDKAEMREKLVGIATRKEDGTFQAVPAPNNDEPVDASGGTGLFSSPEDYLKVLLDLLQDEPKLLSSEYADMLFAPAQLPEDSLALHQLRTELPLLFEGFDVLYRHVSINHSLAGLLWIDSEHPPKAKGVVMWFGALGTMWFAHREKGVAGYYASQMFPPGDPKNNGIMGEFLKAGLSEIPE